MDASEIRRRLDDAASSYMERKNLSVPAPYWEGLERRLIEPAAVSVAAANATDEQIAGSITKLEFLLDEVIAGTRAFIRDKDPFIERALGEEVAETVVNELMGRLCPLWPFCG